MRLRKPTSMYTHALETSSFQDPALAWSSGCCWMWLGLSSIDVSYGVLAVGGKSVAVLFVFEKRKSNPLWYTSTLTSPHLTSHLTCTFYHFILFHSILDLSSLCLNYLTLCVDPSFDKMWGLRISGIYCLLVIFLVVIELCHCC